MITFNHRSFIDELQKLATALTNEEQRDQVLQFAGLGATAAPVVQATKNLITHGKVSPFSSKSRFLASNLVGGALSGGAVPVIQHALSAKAQDRARARAKADAFVKQLPADLTQVKSAAIRAGGVVGGHIIKAAVMNLTGRDNRTPFQGGTQFPTEGSKTKARQFGQAAKNKAEVGPAPLMGKLNKTNMTTVKDVSVKMPTAKGSLPQIGG